MTRTEAIQAYYAKFDEGPPIREMDEQAAIAAMLDAIESGIPMDSAIEKELPDGALH